VGHFNCFSNEILKNTAPVTSPEFTNQIFILFGCHLNPAQLMDQLYKDFEKTIKTKHSFAFTPKFKATINTTLKKELVTEVASLAFKKLEWDVIHHDRDSIEARRKKWKTWTEKIIVRPLPDNKVEIESTALGNEMWDMGRNSRRVRLFEFAFGLEEKNFDVTQQQHLEDKVKREENMDDYVIPETLTPPIERKEPNFMIPAGAGIFVSIVCAFAIAYVSVNVIYVIGFFEAAVAIAFGFALKQGIRWGNFTDVEKLMYVVYAMIAIFFCFNQVFQYEIIKDKAGITDLGFWEFMKYKFENGLTIKKLNTGWVGLIISWVFQILIIYFITGLRLTTAAIDYVIKRIPVDVVEFAGYHLVRGRSEQEVRQELSSKGWTSEQSQNEVFEALGGHHGLREFVRAT
jgi:hypothetical protein